MNIPSKVKVGTTTYTVKFVDELFEHGSMFGEINYVQQIIRIDAGISVERKWQTFFHELTHAILFESGKSNGEDDEQLVRMIGNTLTRIAEDNHWVINE